MTDYLNYSFKDSSDFVSTYDELPLWSAPFGLLLLENIEIKPNLNILDIGCGTGFPLLELAQRFGDTCKVTGIDLWVNAISRVEEKIKSYPVKNTSLIKGSAESMPFDDNTFDMIVSNLGINNIPDKDAAFKESYRVLKQNGKLSITTNLYGHWKEFYKIFRETISESHPELLAALEDHEHHRGTLKSVSDLFTNHKFSITNHKEETFSMRFLNGTAFLNHYFIKMGFMDSWKNSIPDEHRLEFFKQLETNLNKYSAKEGELKLTVPMLYIEGRKG
jgi:arsenite methyltransferase